MLFDQPKQALCFDDVLLVPHYSDIISRKNIDLRSNLSGFRDFRLPIISSPMDTVTGSRMAIAMGSAGGLGIIHRYNDPQAQSRLIEYAKKMGAGSVGAAVGVSGDYLERVGLLLAAGCDVICIDVAHGHHALMRHALKVLRKTHGFNFHIMAGNVATLEGFNDLADWGANSIRVGIGGGSICSTRIQTGHGIPTLQSVVDCSTSDRDATLIADGGIRTSGDIVKALAAGADFVMIGSLLAGTTEAPGDVIHEGNGDKVKTYRGMASKEAQIDWRGHTSSIEGVSSLVPYKGPVHNILGELEIGLKSGLSYTGASTLRELQRRAQFITQSSAGRMESETRAYYK